MNAERPEGRPLELDTRSVAPDIEPVIPGVEPVSAGVEHEDERSSHPRLGEPEALYVYRNVDGAPVLEVCRFPGKRFLQRDPRRPAGEWGLLPDTPRPIYRLDRIEAHIASDSRKPLFLVEGERDVEAIELAGGVATTNVGGALKWSDENTRSVLGCRAIVIVADRDEPGRRHAQAIAASLGEHGYAGDLEILQAADGKDAADHLSAGYALDQLVPLPEGTDEAAARTDPTVTLAEFVARKPDIDAPSLIVCEQGPIAPAGALLLHAGKASAGKTTQAIDLLLHAAAGVDYCGLSFPRPLRILVIENEGPREGFRQKIESRLEHGPAGEPIRIWDDPARWGMIRVSDDELRDQLRGIVDAHQIDLVVSDSLTRFGMNGNGTPEETRDFMAHLAAAGLGRDVGFFILAHTRSRTDNDADELEQLAGAWAPHADAILMLRKLEGNRARLSYPKTRWTRGTVPAVILAFDPTTETFTLVATETGDAEKIGPDVYETRVLEWVADHPWATTEELDEGAEGRVSEVRKARQRLEQSGRVISAPSAQLGLPGRGKRWNTAPEHGFSPVPLPGTGMDDLPSDPLEEANPVRPVRPLSKNGRRDGVSGRGSDSPDDSETFRSDS